MVGCRVEGLGFRGFRAGGVCLPPPVGRGVLALTRGEETSHASSKGVTPVDALTLEL